MLLNTHLKPVFEVLLPSLNDVDINYWVFGGVGIAAYAGKFIRNNKDVDIFVKETDFLKTTSALKNICVINSFEQIIHAPIGSRPKIDIKINGKELLSVIPVYLRKNIVEFRFGKVIDQYPIQVMDSVERDIDGNRFYTPPNEYIKRIFLNHLVARRDKLNRPGVKIDIEVVFTPEERIKFNL